VPPHDHLGKVPTDTSIMINGTGLVLEFSKFRQPNELIKKRTRASMLSMGPGCGNKSNQK